MKGMLKLHQRVMRNGWCIPHLMEWLFWPMGYKAPTPITLIVEQGSAVEFWGVVTAATQRSLAARFKVTNYDAWMAILRRLGAIREEKR